MQKFPYLVTHVITTLDRGGAERALLDLARTQINRGFRVEVIPLKGKNELYADFKNSGIRVVDSVLNQGPIRQLKLLKSILESRVNRNGVIHAHLPRAELVCRLALGDLEFVATRHNSESFWPSVPSIVSSWLSRYVVRNVTLCAISNSVKEFVYTLREVPRENDVRVIYYNYARARIQSTLNSKVTHRVLGESIRIGAVARLANQKGLDLLISAIPLVLVQYPNLTLDILGDGPDRSKLINQTKKLGLSESVHFFPRREDPEVFIRELDLFVLPSRYEGLGRVLLEAMDMEVPIIASKVGAILEVLSLKHPGLVEPLNPIALASRIKEFIDSPTLVKQSLNIQRERLSHFVNYKQCEEYAELYFKILTNRSRI